MIFQIIIGNSLLCLHEILTIYLVILCLLFILTLFPVNGLILKMIKRDLLTAFKLNLVHQS